MLTKGLPGTFPSGGNKRSPVAANDHRNPVWAKLALERELRMTPLVRSVLKLNSEPFGH
jgi:hypothetical protein